MANQERPQGHDDRLRARTKGWRRFGWILVLTVAIVGLAMLLGDRDAGDHPPDPATPLADPSPSLPPPAVAIQNEVQASGSATQLPPGANSGWQAVDVGSVEAESIPVYKETVEDAVLVELSPAMWSWNAGEQIALSVPQIGMTFTPVIDRVETALGSNRSYVGRLTDDEFPYSFVITVGERNAFANLSTPQGSFELVGNTQLAWLMPVANMDQHVDYSQPDYFIPEDPFENP